MKAVTFESSKSGGLKRGLSASGALVVLAACVLWALRTQDLSQIASLLKSVRVVFFLLTVSLALGGVSLTATNLYLLLRRFENAPTWWRVFELDLLSLLGVYYTPGGSGGLAFLVYSLKQQGVDPRDSASCLVLDKLITVSLALCSLCVLAALHFRTGLVAVDRSRFLLIAVGIGLCGLALMAWRNARTRVAMVLARIRVFWNYPRVLAANLAITFGAFCLSACGYAVAFLAVNAPPPSAFVLLISYGPLASLAYLPFTISGAGITEAAAVALWKGPNLSSEEIISAFLVLRAFSLVSSLSLSAAVYGVRLARDKWRQTEQR